MIKRNKRYYKIGDISIKVITDSLSNINDQSIFKEFEINPPDLCDVVIKHRFIHIDPCLQIEGEKIYHGPAWVIYKNRRGWVYISRRDGKEYMREIAVINNNYTNIQIYHDIKDKEKLHNKGLPVLSMSSLDQIILANVLSDRKRCILHAAGIIMYKKGLLFVGHSGAGKSTLTKTLKDKVEILSDESIVVRKHNKGFTIYGTWRHGELPLVSAKSAPLRAILFLEKAKDNRILGMDNTKQSFLKLLTCTLRPLPDYAWWDKSISLITELASIIPSYTLQFDISGNTFELLKTFFNES